MEPPLQTAFDADDPRSARRAAAQVLTDWGLGPVVADAELVVAELTANAAFHGGGITGIRLAYDRGRVRVEVADRSPDAPRSAAPAAGTGGRGLRIVSALSSEWGWSPRNRGKVVWAELALPAPDPDPGLGISPATTAVPSAAEQPARR